MNHLVYRSCQEPIREGLTWIERWKGSDNGLIVCWEVGRKLSKKNPDLANRAKKGELPILAWKGGIDKEIKVKKKYGTLQYLAQWQGLRGEDLDINVVEECELTCSKTNVKVIYTNDLDKVCL